jgi:hypothetical protein
VAVCFDIKANGAVVTAAELQKVMFQRPELDSTVRVGPWTEVVEFPSNLLRLSPSRMGEEWEVGIRLARLRLGSRLTGHGELPLQQGVTVSGGCGGNDTTAAQHCTGVSSRVSSGGIENYKNST